MIIFKQGKSHSPSCPPPGRFYFHVFTTAVVSSGFFIRTSPRRQALSHSFVALPSIINDNNFVLFCEFIGERLVKHRKAIINWPRDFEHLLVVHHGPPDRDFDFFEERCSEDSSKIRFKRSS